MESGPSGVAVVVLADLDGQGITISEGHAKARGVRDGKLVDGAAHRFVNLSFHVRHHTIDQAASHYIVRIWGTFFCRRKCLLHKDL